MTTTASQGSDFSHTSPSRAPSRSYSTRSSRPLPCQYPLLAARLLRLPTPTPRTITITITNPKLKPRARARANLSRRSNSSSLATIAAAPHRPAQLRSLRRLKMTTKLRN
ncbi:hypothetical protein TrVFT333_008807 [Trichoderma virens FT-333]|nr:hypothetical protein TrVFT333_008807 [Trichoderma virens FT-333]